MTELQEKIIELFKADSAALTSEEVAKSFPQVSLVEIEDALEQLWERDVLCRLESFCSILYTLE